MNMNISQLFPEQSSYFNSGRTGMSNTAHTHTHDLAYFDFIHKTKYLLRIKQNDFIFCEFIFLQRAQTMLIMASIW